MLKSRIPKLALAAVAIASAAGLTVAGATAITAAAAMTVRHETGVVHIVHSGFVRDCVDITNDFAGGIAIAGNGVNEPVTLFAIKFSAGNGWVVGNVTDGTGYNLDSAGCDLGAQVQMEPSAGTVCPYWNFPAG